MRNLNRYFWAHVRSLHRPYMHHFLSVLCTGVKIGENNLYLQKSSSLQYKIWPQYTTPSGLQAKNVNYTLRKFCLDNIFIAWMTLYTSYLQMLRQTRLPEIRWTCPPNFGKVRQRAPRSPVSLNLQMTSESLKCLVKNLTYAGHFVRQVTKQGGFFSAYRRISADFPRIFDPPWDQYKSGEKVDQYVGGGYAFYKYPKLIFSPGNSPPESTLLLHSPYGLIEWFGSPFYSSQIE